jgi:hypothetical protein
MKLAICSLFVLALPFAVARADHPHPGSGHQPPPAAFEACAKLTAGAACSVTIHDHTMAGLCAAAADGAALFCRPDHPPGPPPEAVEACSGRNAGDACSVAHGDQALAGSCDRGPGGDGPLACRPSQPPAPR